MDNVITYTPRPKAPRVRRLVWCGVRHPKRSSAPRKVFAGRIDGAVLVMRVEAIAPRAA